jgi:hypothetical protein
LESKKLFSCLWHYSSFSIKEFWSTYIYKIKRKTFNFQKNTCSLKNTPSSICCHFRNCRHAKYCNIWRFLSQWVQISDPYNYYIYSNWHLQSICQNIYFQSKSEKNVLAGKIGCYFSDSDLYLALNHLMKPVFFMKASHLLMAIKHGIVI